MSYTTRYHYSIILMTEKALPNSGTEVRSYTRQKGYQFALSPAGAASVLENMYTNQGKSIYTITLRLSTEDGQIVLETQNDDAQFNSAGKVADKTKELWTDNVFKDDQPSYWEYLTFVDRYTQAKPTLRVEDHMK